MICRLKCGNPDLEQPAILHSIPALTGEGSNVDAQENRQVATGELNDRLNLERSDGTE